jgi:hypothetical protein
MQNLKKIIEQKFAFEVFFFKKKKLVILHKIEKLNKTITK